MRSEISHLQQVMCQTSKNWSSGNITGAFPAFRGIGNFKFNMFFDIVKAGLLKPPDHCQPCFLFQIIPVLFFLFIYVSRTYNERERILIFRCGRRVSPCRSVDIEARMISNWFIFEDTIESFTESVRKENTMVPELRINLIESPVKADGRAGILFSV